MLENNSVPQQEAQPSVQPQPWVRPDFEAFDAAPEVTAYFAQD
ncbi:hypothetical protein ABIA32_005696 [Streptacidiphilus sp. MAP12-20]